MLYFLTISFIIIFFLLLNDSNHLIQFNTEVNNFYSNSRQLLSIQSTVDETDDNNVYYADDEVDEDEEVINGGSMNKTTTLSTGPALQTSPTWIDDNTNTVTEQAHLLSRAPLNCTEPAIDEFPADGFTRRQRRGGWITLHILFACYCFWFLAIICDDYFVPAIESMCASK